jgi:hypothetical protein
LVFPCGGSTTLEVCFIISITISLSLYLFIFLLWLFGWHVSICFLYFLFLSKCHLVYNKLLGDVFWSTKHVLDLHFTLKPNIWNITVCMCVYIYIYTNMYHMNIYSQPTCNICRCHLVYNKLLGDVFWSTKHVLDLHFTLKPNIWNITVCVCVCIYIYTNMYHMNIYSQSTCNICRYIFKRKEFEAKVNILLKSSIWQTHSSHSI